MSKYNYMEEVKSDIREWGRENSDTVRRALEHEGLELWEIREQLENDDSVTGNLSGSYFYNAYKAQEAIDNSGILWDEDFRNYLEDTGASLSEVMERGAEVLDAYIRCYEISQIDDVELEGLLTGAGE